MKRAAALLALLALTLCACGRRDLRAVDVFFTADIQGVFWSRPEPRYGNEAVGGLAVLKSFLDKQTAPFLLLDGGDWFSQTPEGTLSKGEYFNQAASSLPYDARAFSDKDLMYGWPSLSDIVRASSAPFVLSNIALSSGKLPRGVQKYMIKEVNGVKIGIFGLVGRKAMRDKRRLGALRIEPEVQAARQAVQTLRQKGARAVVLLSTLGVQEGKDAVTDVSLAEEVQGIDVILSADLGREESQTEQVGNTHIFYAGSRFDGVGRARLFFDKKGELADVKFEDVTLYRRDFGEDAAVAEKVADMRRRTRTQMSRPAGRAAQTLSGAPDRQSALGSWAADCLRKWARADAAILNADALRADLPAGPITQYDLYRVYPYADNVTYLTIKGAALRRALEAGLSSAAGFAQISGLEVTYRPDLPEGKRILSVRVGGVPLASAGTYRVAVTDHMLAGGAGHDEFIDSLEFKNTQVEVRTVLRNCLATGEAAAPADIRWRKAP